MRNNVSQQQGGVYRIPCRNCDRVYIGETGRNLETRINEHKRDVANCNTNNSVFVHAYDNNHIID